MKTKFASFLIMTLGLLFLLTPFASAHVVVGPAQAVAGERVTFSVSVPNEKDVPVTGLKVAIPAGFDDVTPTVHSGWTIEATLTDDKPVAITWSGGEIPAGQRDDFTFRAQVPAKVKELQWKAYQTYADGTTVAWDQTPSDTETESETSGPYSVTAVSAEAATTKPDGEKSSGASIASVLAISLAALAGSIFALLRKNKN